MTDLLYSLAEYLDQLGHGRWSPDAPYTGDPNESVITVGMTPSGPDRCVTIARWPTPAALSSSNQPEVLEGVEFRVRGTPDYRVSDGRCTAILDDLHGTGLLTLPSGLQVVNMVSRQGSPLDMGADENNRVRHSVVIDVEYLRPSRLRPA